MDIIQDYIVPVTMAICWCIGIIVKKWIKDINNKWIPTICAVVGIVVNVWINGWIIDPAILLGGMASGLAATGFDQMVRTGEVKR